MGGNFGSAAGVMLLIPVLVIVLIVGIVIGAAGVALFGNLPL